MLVVSGKAHTWLACRRKNGAPQSKSSYRVAIRGLHPGDNFCECSDYATNELGTCKHIEFTLAELSGLNTASGWLSGVDCHYKTFHLAYVQSFK